MSLTNTAKGAISMLLSHGIRMGFGFLLMIAIARSLGPEQFGLYSSIISMAWIAQGLISFGIQTPLFQDLVSDKKTGLKSLCASFYLHALTSCMGIGIYLLLIYFCFSSQTEAFWGAVILCPILLFPLIENLNQVIIAQQKSHWTASASLIAFVGASFLSLYFLQNPSMGKFLFSFMLEFILLAFIIGYIFFSLKLPQINWTPNFQIMHQLAKRAFPLFLAIGIQLLHQRISIILIEQWSSSQNAGIFAAAFRVISLISSLMLVLSTPFFAQISHLFYHAKDQFTDTLKSQLGFMTMLTLAIFLFGFILFPELIIHLLGHQYIHSLDLFLPLGLSAFLFCLRPMYDRIINLWESPWLELWSYFHLSLSLIVFSVLWIPNYGALGAAWAYCASIVWGQFIVLGLHTKSRQFLFLQIQALFAFILWPFGLYPSPLKAIQKE